LTSPRTITRAVQLVFGMRDVLRRHPISADDLAGGDYRLALRRVRQVELEAMQIQRSAARNQKEAEKLLANAAQMMTQAQREAIRVTMPGVGADEARSAVLSWWTVEKAERMPT